MSALPPSATTAVLVTAPRFDAESIARSSASMRELI